MGTGLIDAAGCACRVSDVCKVGYVGMSDFDVIGSSVAVSGEVIKIALHSIEVSKVHDPMAVRGVEIVIDDVVGVASC